jgi:hypothetical protein
VSGNITGNAANVTGTVAVANGGTGATTAATARVNLLPSYTGNATKVLTVNAGETDVTWTTAGGGGGIGDVVGPASSTDNAVARFDGTTGKLIQNSNFVVSDSGEVTSGTWNGTPIQSATGGTGQTSYSAGQLLIGNNSGGLTKSTLTAGSNVTITNGNGAITIASTGGGLSWQSVQTTGFTAVSGRGYPCNTTSAAFTVTLPASPTAGDLITLVDYAGTWDTNNLTVNPNGGKINGSTGNGVVSTERGAVNLVYVDSTQGWISYASNLSTSVLQSLSFDYAVVAGGGGGGGSKETPAGGGGGAGGMKTGTATAIAFGTVFTVTVGGFGAGGSGQAAGSQGGTSSLAATGFTTVSTTGGGGGAAFNNKAGTTGGSGGGGSGLVITTGYAGTSGEGSAGGDGANQAGGGGGGKGGAGGNGNAVTTYVGGVGGTGSEWPASSGTYYAGGGGGGGSAILQSGSYAGGAGGSGVGGAGSASGNNGSVSNGTAGTINTGGGGGGGGGSNSGFQTVNGGNGGSGVVIIRYADTYPAASATTGSPTITVSGGYRTYKFTDSGSITF